MNDQATKQDINKLKEFIIDRFATKDDLKGFATKDDLKGLAEKADVIRVENKLDKLSERSAGRHLELRADIGELNQKHDRLAERISEVIKV